MAEVSLKNIISGVEKLANTKLSPKLRQELLQDIRDVFRTEVKEALGGALIDTYDQLVAEENAQYGTAAAGKDPMSLDNLRPLFVEQIMDELSNIDVIGDNIVIEVGNKEKWGYGKERGADDGLPESVDILVYYIEGVIGEWGFISLEHYLKRRSASNNLGRFGLGFLISKEDYVKEKWEEVTGLSFDQVRHPISGQQGFKGFEQTASSFNYGPYVGMAVQRTLKKIPELIGR